MCPADGQRSTAVNIVLMKDQVVAEDVVLTLSDLYPHVEAVAVPNLRLLSEMIDSLSTIRFAILEVSEQEFRANPNVANLNARGAHVILVDDLLDDGIHGSACGAKSFCTLEKPFSTETLVACLSKHA